MCELKKVYNFELKFTKQDELFETLFKKLVVFRKDSDNLEGLIDKVESEDLNNNYVWVLASEPKVKGFKKVLQVAKSNNIKGEIIGDLKLMFSKDENNEVSSNETKKVNTQFYEGVYKRPLFLNRKDKVAYLYRMIGNEYEQLSIYILKENIDLREYFHTNGTMLTELPGLEGLNEAYRNEAITAFYTKALYWNAYKGGADMKTIKALLGENKNTTCRG